MTQYYPGPWEVEIFYTEGGITHKQRLNCDIVSQGAVGDPFSAFTVSRKDNAVMALDTALLAYLTVARGIFSSTTNFTIANLYKYEPESYDKTFKATYDINLLGTGSGGAQLSHYTMLTFTTVFGNNMKLVYVDDSNSLATRIPIRDASAPIQAIATYVVSSSNWILARDGSFPAGRLNSSQGQNEALFKTRNR